MAYTGIWTDTLPWSDTENDRKLVGYVFIAMAVSTVLFVIMQFLPLMDVQEKKLEEVAPRLAKLIIEKQAQPKPPPPVPKPIPKEKPKPKPKTEKKPIPKPKPKTAPKPKPDRTEVAKKQAQRQMQVVEDALADLREFDVASLDKNKPITSGAAAATNTTNTTAIIAARAKEGSGGINTSSLSRATGGGDLAGRQTTNVQSTIGAGGGVKGTRSGGGSGLSSRSNEEVELVFQSNKSRFNSLYQRALRSDPSLQGKVVVKLKIAPSGKVIDCRLVSSDLKNPELEKKIIDRILLFKFKPLNNVDTLEVTYPLDFLPT